MKSTTHRGKEATLKASVPRQRSVALGLSIALGQLRRKWPGWIALASGVAFVGGGVITAQTGFSPEATVVLLPAFLLLAIFLVGVYVSMWGGADQ